MSTAAEQVREPGLHAVYAVRGADHDNIVFLREASWNDFHALPRMRGEHSAPRLNYLCGEVEIITPSRTHESSKFLLGRHAKVYCVERGIRFRTLGARTLESAEHERAAESDECWIFGAADADRPHLAIAVARTAPYVRAHRQVEDLSQARRGAPPFRQNSRNRSPSNGVSGDVPPESVVTFKRNGRPRWAGISISGQTRSGLTGSRYRRP